MTRTTLFRALYTTLLSILLALYRPRFGLHTRRSLFGWGAAAMLVPAAARAANKQPSVPPTSAMPGTSTFPQRSVAMLIAAANSSDADREIAHIVCDGADDQIEIIQALSDGNREVVLLNGSYSVNAPINLPTGSTLRGTSVFGVELICNTPDGIFRSSDPLTRHEHVKIESMRLSPGTNRDLACDFRGFTRSQFNRLRIYQFDLAVWFGGDIPPYDASWTNVLSQFYLAENLVGVRLSGQTNLGNSTANQIILTEGEVICPDGQPGTGIDVVHGQIVVDTCDIGYGDLCDGIVLRSGVMNCRVTNSRFEWDRQDPNHVPIRIEAGSSDHFFSGNFYTIGCTVPNLLDDNGSEGRYIKIDDFPTLPDYPNGFIDFSVEAAFTKSTTFRGRILSEGNRESALAVRNGDHTTLVNIDAKQGTLQVLNGASLMLAPDDGTTVAASLNGETGDFALYGDIVSTGLAPFPVPGSAAGAGASASIFGSGITGLIIFTTGTGLASGDLLTLTWATEKTSADYTLLLTPANAGAARALASVFINQEQQTGQAVSISTVAALAESTEYRFFYSALSFIA